MRNNFSFWKVARKLSVLLIVILFSSNTAIADQCELCHSMNSRYCSEQCGNEPAGSSACVGECMRTECGRHCGGSGAESSGPQTGLTPGFTTPDNTSVADEVMGCQSCVEQMKQGVCVVDCSASERKASCVNRCSKFKCAKKCRLPVGKIKQPRRRYHNCTECKEYATGSCRRKCGDKTRPGFIACEVSCVETKCLKNCRGNQF